MLKLCESFAIDHKNAFNLSKTKCMYFNQYGIPSLLSKIIFMDSILDFIHVCVLLGIPITCNINVNITHSVNSLLYVKSNS